MRALAQKTKATLDNLQPPDPFIQVYRVYRAYRVRGSQTSGLSLSFFGDDDNLKPCTQTQRTSRTSTALHPKESGRLQIGAKLGGDNLCSSRRNNKQATSNLSYDI